jgi:hypothetical protein
MFLLLQPQSWSIAHILFFGVCYQRLLFGCHAYGDSANYGWFIGNIVFISTNIFQHDIFRQPTLAVFAVTTLFQRNFGTQFTIDDSSCIHHDRAYVK